MSTHVFFGTNNPETKREFSEECGRKSIIAPTSALNGSGESIERFDKDTVALVPVSALTNLKPGECIVTQMREDVKAQSRSLPPRCWTLVVIVSENA